MFNQSRYKFITELKNSVYLNGKVGSFFICSVDFADFKNINYYYSFKAGDNLLEAFAMSIEKNPNCIFCNQMSADHFLFALHYEGVPSHSEVCDELQNWWNRFIEDNQSEYPNCKLRLFGGIYQLEDSDIEQGIDNADLAHRHIRKTNTPGLIFFEPFMAEKIADVNRRKVMAEKMLQKGCFRFYLQPQVDIESNKIVSAEALARGFDEYGKIVSPEIFIPVFETSGDILQLDFLILEQVCHSIRKRLDNGQPVVRTAVNLSRLHFGNRNTVEHLHQIVTKYAVPPELITFEVTETVVEYGYVQIEAAINALHSYGYRVSIDDFGSGFAGIDTCHKLSFDELKLDRSLLGATKDADKRGQEIIRGMVGIMKALETDVICEGVESPAQCEQLLGLGCKYAQGFYFSKPLPESEFYERYTRLQGRCN